MLFKASSPTANQQQQLYSSHPFLQSPSTLCSVLETDPDAGLSASAATTKHNQLGPNVVQDGQSIHWSSILFKQATNAMILVLLLAMALSYGVSDYIEGGVITAVIILNVCVGFFQEYQAEKKTDSLRSLSSPSATVIRDAHVHTVPSGEVVPGDIIMVKTGDTIPADLRLFDAMGLECDEKILTGEAIPVSKDVTFKVEIPGPEAEMTVGVGDRLNMVYSSSTVTKGRGKGVAVFTGMETEIGKIAASVGGKKENNLSQSQQDARKRVRLFLRPVKNAAVGTYRGLGSFLGLTSGTPLQIKLNKLAYALFGCALILAIIVFGVNKFNVTNEVAIYAISTGIAIIPESLIAVLTITMVVGMTQMRKRMVIVRQLSALEALGGVTNICSDKTGTLTQGQMIARRAWVPHHGTYTVDDPEDALDPKGGDVTFTLSTDIGDKEDSQSVSPSEKVGQGCSPMLQELLDAAVLCNVATIRFQATKNEWQAIGDPVEVALHVFAHRFHRNKEHLEIESGWTACAEYAFDSTVKRMSIVYRRPTDQYGSVFTKGAVESIVELCSSIGTENRALGDADRDSIFKHVTMLANRGLRVLALANRQNSIETPKSDTTPRESIETRLNFLGLIGFYDPPRLETEPALRDCVTAGIKVHMLTGDHPATAAFIAKDVGIIPPTVNLKSLHGSSLVKTAAEVDGMTDDELDALPKLPLVIARCAPHTKTRMIGALHRRNAFVAMTGDGVNDAPSLKAADIGIAMGQSGSDVAKQASKIVLTDDNFASIVAAISEGRRMFANIQKFILHLLISNVGEIILLIAGLGFQDAQGISVFPLSPLQILWINMLTSSFPAFGLGREPAAHENMSSARLLHQIRRYGVFTPEVMVDIAVYGTIMGTLTLCTFIIIVYGPTYQLVQAGKLARLGFECNRSLDTCDIVFRARAAVFAELTWLILVTALEFKSLHLSLFSPKIYQDNDTAGEGNDADNTGDKAELGVTTSPTTLNKSTPLGLWYTLYTSNRFLFYSIFFGGLSVFPTIYIPGLNTTVFKHSSISWEWGLAVGSVAIYVLGVEGWKATKRNWELFAPSAGGALETSSKQSSMAHAGGCDEKYGAQC